MAKAQPGGYNWNAQVAQGLAALAEARRELRKLLRVPRAEGYVARVSLALGDVQDALVKLRRIGDEGKPEARR